MLRVMRSDVDIGYLLLDNAEVSSGEGPAAAALHYLLQHFVFLIFYAYYYIYYNS